jgi:hypothetical protein
MTTSGRVRIEAPDGQSVYADEPAASEMISSLLGRRLLLENQPQVDEKTHRPAYGVRRCAGLGDEAGLDARDDAGLLPAQDGHVFRDRCRLPSRQRLGRPPSRAAGRNCADRPPPVPAEHLRRTGPATDRFVEDEWIGGTLEVGGTVVLDEFQPTLWCVTSTLAQEELPRDRSVLRTTAQHHAGRLGVYASVRHPGLVRVGDQVVFHGPGVAQPPSRVSGRAGRRQRN